MPSPSMDLAKQLPSGSQVIQSPLSLLHAVVLHSGSQTPSPSMLPSQPGAHCEKQSPLSNSHARLKHSGWHSPSASRGRKQSAAHSSQSPPSNPHSSTLQTLSHKSSPIQSVGHSEGQLLVQSPRSQSQASLKQARSHLPSPTCFISQPARKHAAAGLFFPSLLARMSLPSTPVPTNRAKSTTTSRCAAGFMLEDILMVYTPARGWTVERKCKQ
mmetsp:Transcript_42263/g.109615  ORF Transcript_42263/g.109615 Transcript_42263/m.109615 type:complete len:214 (-) Transcript_42263:33-674(-)